MPLLWQPPNFHAFSQKLKSAESHPTEPSGSRSEPRLCTLQSCAPNPCRGLRAFCSTPGIRSVQRAQRGAGKEQLSPSPGNAGREEWPPRVLAGIPPTPETDPGRVGVLMWVELRGSREKDKRGGGFLLFPRPARCYKGEQCGVETKAHLAGF